MSPLRLMWPIIWNDVRTVVSIELNCSQVSKKYTSVFNGGIVFERTSTPKRLAETRFTDR